MAVFSLLKDPADYRPCKHEMVRDAEFRTHWLAHFEHHFELVMHLAVDTYGPQAQGRADACKAAFLGDVRAFREKPDRCGELTLLSMDRLRQERLIEHGLPDPFEKMKQRENEATLPLYPQVVAELDSHSSEEEALLLATEGVFAGNIFDLGAGATAKRYANESPDFNAVRDGLGGTRPWLVDQYDALAKRLLTGVRPRKAMFFCDNAGSDCLLGVIPFCRFLAKRGTQVMIAANRLPALNDVTHSELGALLERLRKVDATLDGLMRAGRLGAIDSGCVTPLIDLREVSEEVQRHAADTDLVILEGMGRAVESNFEALFTVDALKLAMIKDEMVARKHGGKVFDTVCRFDPEM